MRWDFQVHREQVKLLHGEPVAESLRQHLESVAWKAYIARYHSQQFREILQTAVAQCPWTEESDSPEMIAVKMISYWIAENPSARAVEFELEANLIAAAQSAHSVFDIFAHVLIHSYAIPQSRFSGPIGVYKVLTEIRGIASAATVAKQLDSILQSPAFVYLRAYVNTTKHHSLVRARHSATFGANPNGGLKLRAFKYQPLKGPLETHPAMWANDFLQSIDRLLRDVVRVGSEVNRSLQSSP